MTESTFNNLKLIHTRNRNKLSKDAIKKLSKSHFNGKVIDQDKNLRAQTILGKEITIDYNLGLNMKQRWNKNKKQMKSNENSSNNNNSEDGSVVSIGQKRKYSEMFEWN